VSVAPAPTLPLPSLTEPAEPTPDDLESGPLDERFAELMLRLDESENAELYDAAKLASAARRRGDVCLYLRSVTALHDGFSTRLLDTKVVGRPGEWKPLILDQADRLYLHRYWRYEQELASEIRTRLEMTSPELDRELLEDGLNAFFDLAPNDQRAAAEKALSGNFCVITGGPGTGKTRTVARILALLWAQSQCHGQRPSIALAAPTGKAAARMTESIRAAVAELRDKMDVAGVLEAEAVTLHRLLGTTPENPTPRFDARNPLPIDAVIVDEASMIDLALMAKLFAAVPRTARIILLGDKDQLASVEAGHVLGEICDRRPDRSEHPLTGRIAQLHRSFRFEPGSGIDRFSRSVNAGDVETALEVLRSGSPELTAKPLPSPEMLGRTLREKVVEGFRAALTATDPAAALDALNQFRILAAVRRGPYGVESLNILASQALQEAGLLDSRGLFHHGRPVMILRNDYTLRLFNGDIGLILRDPESGDALRAFFQGPDGKVRRIAPSRLPEHETVWAMTVHKSQGSEFDRMLLILPDRETPLLTRELLYTGITRAKRHGEIWYREESLRKAIARRTERTSGLADALWA